jgi:hypothetical protein
MEEGSIALTYDGSGPGHVPHGERGMQHIRDAAYVAAEKFLENQKHMEVFLR